MLAKFLSQISLLALVWIAPHAEAKDSFQEYLVGIEPRKQASALKELRHLGTVVEHYRQVECALVRMTESQAKRAAQVPGIAYVAPNQVVKGHQSVSRDYGFETVGGPIAGTLGFSGKNIGVAVIDSGIFDHDDLKRRSQRYRLW